MTENGRRALGVLGSAFVAAGTGLMVVGGHDVASVTGVVGAVAPLVGVFLALFAGLAGRKVK